MYGREWLNLNIIETLGKAIFMTILSDQLGDVPAIKKLVDAIVDFWPEHSAHLKSSLGIYNPQSLKELDRFAAIVLKIVGAELSEFVECYQWKCQQILQEEIHFRRYGSYRLSTFDEANAAVYSNPEFMRRYLSGILITQLFWANRSQALLNFVGPFLAANPPGYRHLEVGPGHGLYLYAASQDPNCQSAVGWDVSQTSLEMTRHTFKVLGLERAVELMIRDARQPVPPDGQLFDSAIINEVLEHVEQPSELLAALKQHMKPGGRIFIGFPVNSPAPDHIYLADSPEAVEKIVEDAGLEIEARHLYTLADYTIEKARKHSMTISTIIIARRPA